MINRTTDRTTDRIYVQGDNIIPLPKARAARMFGALKEVEAYWEALRDGRPMPTRAEVDPRGIAGALAHAFIIERIAPGMARLRLAGHHMGELMGMDLRGMPLSALILPEARPKLARMLDIMFEQPARLAFRLEAPAKIGQPRLEAEMFIAPLRDDRGEVTRAIGAFQAIGEPGRAPRRFAINEVTLTALGRSRPLHDMAEGPTPEPATKPAVKPATKPAAKPAARKLPGAKAQGLAESPRPFADARREEGANEGAPSLRLVVSNDD